MDHLRLECTLWGGMVRCTIQSQHVDLALVCRMMWDSIVKNQNNSSPVLYYILVMVLYCIVRLCGDEMILHLGPIHRRFKT